MWRIQRFTPLRHVGKNKQVWPYAIREFSGAVRLREILHEFDLEPGATQKELRKAYYKKAKELHPDLGGSKEEFAELKQTYEEGLKLLKGYSDSSEYMSYEEARRRQAEDPNWRGRNWKQTFDRSGGNERRERPVDFDPRHFREGNRSHTSGSGSGAYSSYSYQTTGTQQFDDTDRESQEPSWTPSQWIRHGIKLVGILSVSFLLIGKMGPSGPLSHNRYTLGAPAVDLNKAAKPSNHGGALVEASIPDGNTDTLVVDAGSSAVDLNKIAVPSNHGGAVVDASIPDGSTDTLVVDAGSSADVPKDCSQDGRS